MDTGTDNRGMTDGGNRTDNRNTTVRLGATLVRSSAADISAGEGVEREILREHRLELVVNEQVIARLVCTAEDLENLVVGRLLTEGIIADAEEIERLYLCESGNRARVFLKKDVRFCVARQEEPTCCTDNRIFLQPAEAVVKRLPSALWKPEWIFGLADAFAEDFRLHKRTGGIHGCMLGREGRVLYRTEDIGRHNAMDKAVGYAARTGIVPGSCMLFTTGRVPTDMVRKAVTAGIPVLVSKAVPTREAVELARECGLTLICRAWPDSFEIYAGGENQY